MKLVELGQAIRTDPARCNCHPEMEMRIDRRCHGHSAKCTGVMVLRLNSVDKQLFWGCSQWPRCENTVPFTLADIR